jgi:hypothetical protein
MKRLFGIVHELSVIKDTLLFKALSHFPPVVEIKHEHQQQD